MTARTVLLLIVMGCAPHVTVTVEPEVAPASIVAACQLAQVRCSRCHTVDRIVHAHVTDWLPQVRRMRLMPGSAIPPREEPDIVRCLVFRNSALEVP